jgi:predicted Kef-type K+ transport protein
MEFLLLKDLVLLLFTIGIEFLLKELLRIKHLVLGKSDQLVFAAHLFEG